jgi:hypothetical protein
MRQAGIRLRQISVILNREGIPTPVGHLIWTKNTVDGVVHTRYARDLLAGRSAFEDLPFRR